MKLLYSIIFLLFNLNTFSQNFITETSAEIAPYWKKGDTRKLEKTTIREKYINDVLVFKTTSKSEIQVKVLDEKDTIYTIEWLFIETNISESEEEVAKRLAEMTNGFKTIYSINDIGVYHKMLNYTEMQDFLAKGMEKMKKEHGIDTVGKDIYNVLKQVFSSDEAIEASFSKDIKLYHFPYGSSYELNELIEEPIILPNPLTGDPVKAQLLFKMTNLDFPGMSCTIEGTMKITEEDSKKYVKEFIEKLKAEGADRIPKESEMPLMEVEDYSKHIVELLTGWVTYASHVRTVKSGIIKQVDTTLFELLPEEEKKK
jgi:hypothetical protein